MNMYMYMYIPFVWEVGIDGVAVLQVDDSFLLSALWLVVLQNFTGEKNKPALAPHLQEMHEGENWNKVWEYSHKCIYTCTCVSYTAGVLQYNLWYSNGYRSSDKSSMSLYIHWSNITYMYNTCIIYTIWLKCTWSHTLRKSHDTCTRYHFTKSLMLHVQVQQWLHEKFVDSLTYYMCICVVWTGPF